MKICLVRHGETDWNKLGKLQGRENLPLNSTGIEQIRAAAKYFRKNNWRAVISSPLLRAKMSAEIIAGEIGGIPIYDEIDFIERDYGKASGMTQEERRTAFPDGNYPEIEPYETLENRVCDALSKSVKNNMGNDIIIVSHGAAINAVLARLSNNEAGTGKTVLKNACITLLEKRDKITIVFYNKTIDEEIEK
jgi:uncharacterized phosphatase